MSKPKVLRWAIAIPLACLLGIALAFGSWHLRGKDWQRESVSAQAGFKGTVRERDEQPSSGLSLPTLANEVAGNASPLSRKQSREQLDQEKQSAANDLLTAYILSNEELPKLNEPAPRPPDHPLVEALINKPKRMRDASLADHTQGMQQLTPLNTGNELGMLQALTTMARRGRLDGYSEDVLKRAGEVFNSPAFDSVRADANAASNLTMEQISRLLEASKDLQRDLERRR